MAAVDPEYIATDNYDSHGSDDEDDTSDDYEDLSDDTLTSEYEAGKAGNYIVRGEGDSEYVLSLDHLNEEELQSLLEELEQQNTTQSGANFSSEYSHSNRTSKSSLEQNKYDSSNGGSANHQPYDKESTHGNIIKHKYPDLPVLETIFYFCAFWMGAGYSLYKFYRASQKWSAYLPLTSSRGSFWGKYKDDSDLEWYVWPALLVPYFYYAVLHAVVACAIRKHAYQYLRHLYIVSSMSMLYIVVGPVGLVLCLTVPSLMFTVLLTRNKQMVWVAWCLVLLFFNIEPVTSSLEQFMSSIPEGDYKVSVMVAWIILRSLSFCLETCDADPENNLPVKSQALTLFAYCLYLPFLFTGPYMPYLDFVKGLNAPYRAWNKTRLIKFFLQLIRFFAWMSVANFLTYHFYAHALHWSPQLVGRLNSWALAGFIYYLIVFFLIKYVVLYGIPGVIASIEGYEAPPPPKCVLILSRFSKIWRHFDYGLYMFMTRHIYQPWTANAGNSFIARMQGIILVFTFVYVWHGVTPQVLLWAGINCLGVIIEKTSDYIASLPSYQRLEKRWLSECMQRRWHGFLSMCLLVPSIAALSIFLTSLENASTVGLRVFYHGFPQVTFTFMFFIYCIAQTGFQMHNWKIKWQSKNLKVK